MTTEILRPNGVGIVTDLTPSPAVDNYLNIDEVTKDDDTTYNYATGTIDTVDDAYALENSSINSGTLNKVTIKAYLKSTTTNDIFHLFLFNNSSFGVSFGEPFSLSQANVYEFASAEFTQITVGGAPPRALEWTDIADLQVVMGITPNSEDNTCSITQIWLEVDYTETHSGSAIISGNGTVSVISLSSTSVIITISGNGILTLISTKQVSDTALISGNGLVVVVGLSATPGVILISGGGYVIATGEGLSPAVWSDWNTAINADVRQWRVHMEVYFDGDGSPPTIFTAAKTVGWDLLEEAYAEGATPLGAVSSNEFILTLDNSDRYFTPTNENSPYYDKLLPNVLIKATLAIKVADETYQSISLGEYRTGDWSAPSDLLEAEVICHDDIYELGQRNTPQVPALQSINLQFMWSILLKALNLDESNYIIDEFIQAISIGWFKNGKVMENLQLLAERGVGAVYGDRDSKVRIKSYYYPSSPLYFWNDNNQIVIADLPQNYSNVYSRVKVNYYQPYVTDTSTLFTLNYTVPADGITLERLQISSGPVGIYEGVNIINATNVSIGDISMGIWDITIELLNSGTEEEEVTLEIVGKKINYIQSTVMVEDTDLYNKIGDVTLSIDNHLVQSEAEAITLANYILQLVTDPAAYTQVATRGNPYIELTDTMNIDYPNGNINNLDIIPIRLHHMFRDGLSAEVEGIKKSVRELG